MEDVKDGGGDLVDEDGDLVGGDGDLVVGDGDGDTQPPGEPLPAQKIPEIQLVAKDKAEIAGGFLTIHSMCKTSLGFELKNII